MAKVESPCKKNEHEEYLRQEVTRVSVLQKPNLRKTELRYYLVIATVDTDRKHNFAKMRNILDDKTYKPVIKDPITYLENTTKSKSGT